MTHLESTATTTFDPSAPARLSDQATLRPEPFGALAYHYGTRRLVFVKTKGLVRVLEHLGEYPTARDAVVALVAPREVDATIAALARLHVSGVVDGG
ncbi:MAG TPA: mycofactocin biosynthesis chaperone MftB [Acidimicrobiales bacterium]|nr:mycofactocin biosynthesis chaperone MftB [Acidimicrobiales bacterium]